MIEDAMLPTGARLSAPGEPTWELAYLFPEQGNWTESEYLALETNRLVELRDGFLEVLPLPTLQHHRMVAAIFKCLDEYVEARGAGLVLFAPLAVHLGPRRFREPDVVFLRRQRIGSINKHPEGADLVVEVVSPGEENRERDLVTKPEDYAAAGIPEYWIVDPERNEIKVLVLDGAAYREHGVFKAGQRACSRLLVGFEVAVAEVFAAGK